MDPAVYIDIFVHIHTYMYVSNNSNQRKRGCQLQRGHETHLREGSWEGLEGREVRVSDVIPSQWKRFKKYL